MYGVPGLSYATVFLLGETFGATFSCGAESSGGVTKGSRCQISPGRGYVVRTSLRVTEIQAFMPISYWNRGVVGNLFRSCA